MMSLEEYLNYCLSIDVEHKNFLSISGRMTNALDSINKTKEEVRNLSKDLELAYEQISFRDAFIEAILAKCNESIPRKDFVELIRKLFSDSCIEL